jgi:hypothetical protein
MTQPVIIRDLVPKRALKNQVAKHWRATITWTHPGGPQPSNSSSSTENWKTEVQVQVIQYTVRVSSISRNVGFKSSLHAYRFCGFNVHWMSTRCSRRCFLFRTIMDSLLSGCCHPFWNCHMHTYHVFSKFHPTCVFLAIFNYSWVTCNPARACGAIGWSRSLCL